MLHCIEVCNLSLLAERHPVYSSSFYHGEFYDCCCFDWESRYHEECFHRFNAGLLDPFSFYSIQRGVKRVTCCYNGDNVDALFI